MLDRAVDAYQEADLERALDSFDAAARNADLTIEELLQLFEMRALVHHALGDETSMRADLRRLLAVRGSYQLSRLAPPSVRAVFDEVREAQSSEHSVELRIEEKTLEGQSWMVAQVLRVPEGLVDHTTLQCNIASNARTISRTSQGTSASLKLPDPGVHNGCAATARTRQGGVLFTATIEGAQVLMPSGAASRFEMPRHTPRDDGRRAKKKKWPWIVAASAVVVAAGVTAGVVLSQRSKNGDQPPVGPVAVNW
ncbi:MAG: hypothetical protein HKN10_01040 [Myxococcales bacterium]|nr:hypothetical protein [Deltaproteobacteria bacterium]NNE17035.1 hypothetical protein [Myxococcales bacterium]